jgi:hypothetical protein
MIFSLSNFIALVFLSFKYQHHWRVLSSALRIQVPKHKTAVNIMCLDL